MAETILSSIAEGVLGKLGSLVGQDIALVMGLKREIKKLQNTFSAIRSVLSVAEKQPRTNDAVKDWLKKLKDVLYDVDDVLDELSTEALRRQVEIHGSKLKEVSNFFSPSNPIAFRYKIGYKIKKFRERLNDITKDWRDLQSDMQLVDMQVENTMWERTDSHVEESDVIGRDYDKDQIVNLLLRSSNDKPLSVIPIVGIGGIGKTTLAQLVYNDDSVIENFELRMWVCVYKDFDIKNLVEKILESASGVNYGYKELDPLQRCLRNILDAKKFLLVLDNVWNDDSKKWKKLKKLLTGGAIGSKIVVTTRDMTIASFMGTMKPYQLGVLPAGECLSILRKCAFEEGQEKWHPELEEIGKEIVTKCGGIPLAVTTLGSLLCMKIEEREWLHIKDNDIWKLEQKENDILPALRVSYQQLPSYLKQCFVYCSIIPKDYNIRREELINLWMAQGFLQPLNKSEKLEDIGNRYFNELMSRSFFQEDKGSFDDEIDLRKDEISNYKIHDLILDLARQVASEEWMNVDFNSQIISEVRHVLFVEKNLSEKKFPTSLLSATKLRSFSFACEVGPTNKSFVETLIFHFKCLRVLNLADSEFEELPRFVGELKHLRFLNLSGNRSLKALPNSICKLLNLQTLYLSDCEKLQDLPKDIGKLINLRYLSLTSQLICMPETGLQGLTSLRTLNLSKLSRMTALSEGVQYLTCLQIFRIRDCPSLRSLPSGMKHLTALEKLEICNCGELNLLEGEDMQGLSSLRSLTIDGLWKLVTLPRGLHSAATLQYLCIRNCPDLTTLPEWLQALKSLRKLVIECCPKISSLPDGLRFLHTLRVLVIEYCENLSSRCRENMGADWSKISHIPNIVIDRERKRRIHQHREEIVSQLILQKRAIPLIGW